MRLVIHMFRKDVRRMALPIVAAVSIIAVAAFSEIREHQSTQSALQQSLSYIDLWFLPFAWILLIAGVVLQEPLAGDRQYWLVRPISRLSLLLEKLIFIALFVNLLWFLSDCAILLALGFPIRPLDLLLRQIPMSVILFLPGFCLACLVSSLGELALGLIVCALITVLEVVGPMFLGPRLAIDLSKASLDWVAPLLLASCALVIALQFARPRTSFFRPLFVVPLLMIPLFVVRTANQLHSSFPAANSPSVRLAFDLASGRHPRGKSVDPFTRVEMPVRLDGLPPGVYAEGRGSGSLRSAYWGFDSPLAAVLYSDENGYWLRLSLDLGGRNFDIDNIRSKVALNLYKIEDSIDVSMDTQKPFSPSPGIVCQATVPNFPSLRCWRGPVREIKNQLRAFVSLDGEFIELNNSFGPEFGLPWTFAPLVDWTLSPMRTYPVAFQPGTKVRIMVLTSLGSIERSLTAGKTNLSAYIVKP